MISQGSGGGIGRVELLLGAAFERLESLRNLEVRSIRKLNYPGYLRPHQQPQSVASGSKSKLAVTALRQWISAKPHIVLFNHVNLSPLGMVMRALRPQTKLITVFYGIEAWGPLSLTKSLAIRRSDAIWTISDFTRRILVCRTGLQGIPIRLLPLALLPDQVRRLTTDSMPSPTQAMTHGLSILSVARLDTADRRKGIDHMLEAVAIVARSVPLAAYTVVGEGNDLGRLRALAQALGISNRVCFRGAINDDLLAAAYHECDVFALSSAKEGFGLVFLEAMEAGRPVVAAAAGAAPEVVVDNETGKLVKYGDVNALANALISLLTNPSLRRQMGAAGKGRAEEHFSFDRFTRRLGDLIDEVREPSILANAAGS